VCDYLQPISGRSPPLRCVEHSSVVGGLVVGVGIPFTAVEIQQRRAGLK
jgi:hypothetical protein